MYEEEDTFQVEMPDSRLVIPCAKGRIEHCWHRCLGVKTPVEYWDYSCCHCPGVATRMVLEYQPDPEHGPYQPQNDHSRWTHGFRYSVVERPHS